MPRMLESRKSLGAILLALVIAAVGGYLHSLGPGDPDVCPECHSKAQVVPIVYGSPSLELAQEGQKKGFVLGGCMCNSTSPLHFCKTCHKSW
jgi:hypothetical protein